MLMGNKGWVYNQGEILASLFQSSGYSVRKTSKYPNRILRLSDTTLSIIYWRKLIDIAIVDVFSGLGFYLVDWTSWLLSELGIPFILVLRGGNLPEFTSKNNRLVRKVLQRANAIVAPSTYLKKQMGVDFEVSVISNVLDLSHYPYKYRPEVEPSLLWMRTFHDIYNLLMAIDVLVELKKYFPDESLVMAGQDKGLLSIAKKYAQKSQVFDQIRFPGLLNMVDKQI
jgi:L-malate glycosyltransferase